MEMVKSIQSILDTHELEGERLFKGTVTPNGHTKPNPYESVRFIFHVNGLSISQSTFIKRELLHCHNGMLPVDIPERGKVPFTLFTNQPSDAAVSLSIHCPHMSAEEVNESLVLLGVKPFFVAEINNHLSGKLGPTAGDAVPTSLGLSARGFSPKQTHTALVESPSLPAHRKIKAASVGLRFEIEGESRESAFILRMNRSYVVIQRQRKRVRPTNTPAWGKPAAPTSTPAAGETSSVSVPAAVVISSTSASVAGVISSAPSLFGSLPTVLATKASPLKKARPAWKAKARKRMASEFELLTPMQQKALVASENEEIKKAISVEAPLPLFDSETWIKSRTLAITSSKPGRKEKTSITFADPVHSVKTYDPSEPFKVHCIVQGSMPTSLTRKGFESGSLTGKSDSSSSSSCATLTSSMVAEVPFESNLSGQKRTRGEENAPRPMPPPLDEIALLHLETEAIKARIVASKAALAEAEYGQEDAIGLAALSVLRTGLLDHLETLIAALETRASSIKEEAKAINVKKRPGYLLASREIDKARKDELVARADIMANQIAEAQALQNTLAADMEREDQALMGGDLPASSLMAMEEETTLMGGDLPAPSLMAMEEDTTLMGEALSTPSSLMAMEVDTASATGEDVTLGRGKRMVKPSLKAKENLEAKKANDIETSTMKKQVVKLSTEAKKILAAEKKEKGVATVATAPVLDE